MRNRDRPIKDIVAAIQNKNRVKAVRIPPTASMKIPKGMTGAELGNTPVK